MLALDGIWRTYSQGDETIEVLRGVTLEVGAGEMVALVGPSGAGKSTLLHIAGLLESADRGQVIVDGEVCGQLNDIRRTRVRRDKLGFVYQFHHLLPEFTARENVILPQLIAGRSPSQAGHRADELLARLGVAGRAAHRPGRLSGGEQQRIAVARALANGPKVLLADEPTGNLDHGTAEAVFEHLARTVYEDGLAALVATHNLELAGRMDRMIALQDGVLAEQ